MNRRYWAEMFKAWWLLAVYGFIMAVVWYNLGKYDQSRADVKAMQVLDSLQAELWTCQPRSHPAPIGSPYPRRNL